MKKLTKFLFWTLLFAAAYTQSPLYTSNQNQYLLRGLAAAGVGFLSQDWLVSIPDTVPVFNSLVEWTYRIFNSGTIFYLYYALLMGVYLFSLLGIAGMLFDVQKNRGRRWLFLALLIVTNSAVIRYGFTLARGSSWAYILEDGFAGQRMLGPVFEPSVFAVFLAFAVYLYMKRKLVWAALSAALAATVHPTYLLPAALLVASFMLGQYLEDRSIKKPLVTGGVALAAVAPILAYTVVNFWGSNPHAAAQAQQILVQFRIPHHADISQWFSKADAVKILMIVAGLWLVRKSRLFPVMLFVSLGCAALIVVQVVTGSDALALLFPWRPTILLVPLALAVILAALVQWIDTPHPRLRFQPALVKALPWLSVLMIVGAVAGGILRTAHDFEVKASAPENGLFSYVSQHKKSGETYLIPLKMQDFRLATGAPANVDFKSIPYTDDAVPVWQSKVLMASEFYQNVDCAHLAKFLQQNKVTDIVLETDPDHPMKCPGLTLLYRDSSYRLFALDIPTFLNSQNHK